MYTVMMQTLRKEYIVLFAEIRYSISITTSSTTMIRDKKIIINDILIVSINIPTLLHYFICVAQVFTNTDCLLNYPSASFAKHMLSSLVMI